MPYYNDCQPLVAGLGYELVCLNVVPQNGNIKITAVISSSLESNATVAIGVNDCAKVHRLLLPRLEALLNSQNIYMEVTSPGMERTIKNAAEFRLFQGRKVKVWDSQVTDWVSGRIISSDSESITLALVSGNTEVEDSSQHCIPYARISKAKLLQL